MLHACIKSRLESLWPQSYLECMKRIEAVIRPHRLSQTLTALVNLKITGVTVVDAIGFGLKPGYSEVYEQIQVRQGEDMELGLVPKKLLIMFVEDEHVRKVVDTIAQIARTGQAGDGKIAVSHLEELVRVRAELNHE